MNKVFVLPAGEDWIVDRFVKEWNEDNSDISTNNPNNANIIWLLASWCWRHLHKDFLSSKRVLVTVHHIVPDKFDKNKRIDFLERDEITTAYHVYNEETHDFIKKITNKPIYIIPYWANQKIWKKTEEKSILRSKYSLLSDEYVIGSFQRDTEGYDLKTPKLEKGPDLFIEFLKKISENSWPYFEGKRKIHVLLAGWRREYVISKLNEMGTKYTYIERPKQEIINELYQVLDLYPVTSRYEGGPQSLIECGLLDVKAVSRDIGISRHVLPFSSIKNNIIDAIPFVPNVSKWKLPAGYESYRELIASL